MELYFNQQPTKKQFYYSNKWTYHPVKLILSITDFFFVDFLGSLFIAPFAFGLYHYRTRFFVFFFLFKIKLDAFQKKNEQLSHSRYRLLPPFFQGKSFLVDT